MQGNYPSPSKPNTEPVYLPADYAVVVAGGILPIMYPSVRERTIPAPAGRPPTLVPGLDDPMGSLLWRVDPTPLRNDGESPAATAA